MKKLAITFIFSILLVSCTSKESQLCSNSSEINYKALKDNEINDSKGARLLFFYPI